MTDINVIMQPINIHVTIGEQPVNVIVEQTGPQGPQGTVAVASNAETIEGINNTKAVTPAGLAYALDRRNLNLHNLLTNSGFGVWSNSTLENVGSDLVINGGMADPLTDWSPILCTLASIAGGQSGNCMEMTMEAAASGYVRQFFNLTPGKLYRAVGCVKSGTSGNEGVAFGFYNTNDSTYPAVATGTSSGDWVEYSCVMECPANGGTGIHVFMQKTAGNAGTILLDSVSVYEVTPGCVTADIRGPDGWRKETSGSPLVYREHGGVNTKNGSFYGIKIVSDAIAEAVMKFITGDPALSKFKGRTITFGAWAKTSVANKVRVRIYDGVTVASSNYHSGGGDFEWLETTLTISESVSTLYLYCYAGLSNIAYFSQPMLVYGSSIGEGNYAPKPDEWVNCEALIPSTTFDGVTGFSDVGATTLNLEADTLGKIPKGAKAILANINVNDSGCAATDCVFNLGPDSSNWSASISPHGLANDAIRREQRQVILDANGDLVYSIDATGFGTFDITRFKILAVKL